MFSSGKVVWENTASPTGQGWFFHDTRRAWPCLDEKNTSYLCLWFGELWLRNNDIFFLHNLYFLNYRDIYLINNLLIMARCKCKSRLKPVSVRDYTRFRRGIWEYVRTHCRKLPRRSWLWHLSTRCYKSLSRKGGQLTTFSILDMIRLSQYLLIIEEKIVSLHLEKSYLKSMRNIV